MLPWALLTRSRRTSAEPFPSLIVANNYKELGRLLKRNQRFRHTSAEASVLILFHWRFPHVQFNYFRCSDRAGIYLLLSLLCSAANEIVEALLKKRGIDLAQGIRELLDRTSNTGESNLVKELYNHPLVNSLFGGKYENSRIKDIFKRKIMRTALPSYSPARTFALALINLILPGVTAPLTSPSSPQVLVYPFPDDSNAFPRGYLIHLPFGSDKKEQVDLKHKLISSRVVVMKAFEERLKEFL